MRIKTLLALPVVICVVAAVATAETNVTLSDVHLCCTSCVRGVDAAVAGVAGTKAASDRNAMTVAITAPDKETAQMAVDALVAAGYFGTSSDSSIKVVAPSGAPEGKVQTLTVSGVHLCCGKCLSAVRAVLGGIDGVTGNTAAIKAATFNVTGDFDAKKVFEELNKAGLAGRVAPAAAAPTTAPAAN